MDVIVLNNGHTLIGHTYEEELSLAQVVLDHISLRWVSGGFQAILDRVFWIKCATGGWLSEEDTMELLKFIDHYELEMPVFNEDDKTLRDEIDPTNSMDKNELHQESRASVIRAWRDVWKNHDGVKQAATKYKLFPGDSERSKTELSKQATSGLEEAFWKEVDDLVRAMGCTRQDAYTMASDYMFRPSMLDESEEVMTGEPKWLDPSL